MTNDQVPMTNRGAAVGHVTSVIGNARGWGMPGYTLEFERPILELQGKIHELKQLAQEERADFGSEITRLERKVARLQEEVFANLTAWQRAQIARHPSRPYSLDYIRLMLTDFLELHGDRGYADDRAIGGGLARLG